MRGGLVIFGICLVFSAGGFQNPPQPTLTFRERYEYKHSFKPPYLAQKDGSVPFFEYSGNAIASHESVRITPSLKSQKGMIWSRLPSTFDSWKVELDFRVTGPGRIGADGLAFWFTTQKGVEGPVFGSSDKWNGLGIFFDTFDNDNKRNNPYIMAMGNDGTLAYDHANDGSTQQLAGCMRDFRNKPFPLKAKIEFFRNVLTLLFHSGMSNNEKDFEMCFRIENINLPKSGYFGISAATGGLADDHDVLRFSVSSLHAVDGTVGSQTSPDDESKKFEMEFQEYQAKLKEQKDKWVAENPEQAKAANGDDWNNWFSESDKELQQIFQGQSSIKDTITDLHRKLDEIIGRQERTLSLISTGPQGGFAQQPQGQGQPVGGGVPVDTIRRDEVNIVLGNQREIVSASRDIKNFVSDIHSKTNQLISRGSSQPVGGNTDTIIHEMRDSLNAVKRDLGLVSKRECPQTTGGSSCVSNTFFIVFMIVHIIVLISYLIYRDSKEAQAKKFY